MKNIAKRVGGFTLIELMITVVAIGILVAVALPSYNQYVIRANRAAAQSFMLAIAAKEEQYLLDARSYTATIGAGGLALTQPSETAGRYTFGVTITATPPGYEITATASAGPQLSDGDLTLNEKGVKAPASKWK